MKISVKATITSLAALFVLVLLGGLVAYFSVTYVFDDLQYSDAEKRMEFIRAAIHEDALQMKGRAVKADLTADPGAYFPGITYCDVFVFGKKDGAVIESCVDPRFFRLTSKSILYAYLSSSEEGRLVTGPEGDSGIIDVSGQLIVYGVVQAQPETFILVGKIIDSEYVRKLTRLNEFQVSIYPYDKKGGENVESAKKELAKGGTVYVAPGGGEWTSVYGLLREQDGHPVAIIKAINNTATIPYGIWIIFGAIILMAAVGLGVIVANLGGVRFGLEKRIGQAKKTIEKIRDSSDLTKRIEIKGHDEISELNLDINAMLERLGQAYRQEFISQQLYTELAEATHNRVIVFGPDLKIDYINSEATAEFGEHPDDVFEPDWISPLPPEQQSRDRQRTRKVFETGVGEHIEEEREFAGEKRWVDTWLVPIKDETDRVVKVLVSSQDITERKIAEERTTKARDFYIYLFDNFPNPVWRADAVGRCNYVNKAAIAFSGKEEAQLMNKGWEQSVFLDDVSARAKLLDQAAKTRAHTEIEYRMRRYDGTYRWVIDYVQPIYNLRNRFAGFYGMVVDVTERRLKADELAYMATHDMLTDTANRRRFDEEIENAVAKAKRGETSALLFIDLDDFKSINDSLGHQEGDKALAAVAKTARRVLRKEDLLARLGGDEFAVVLEGQSLEDAMITATRLTTNVNKKVKVSDGSKITISIGITAIHEKAAAGKAMAEADGAMYEAKRRGGNRALVFEPGFIDYNY